MKKEILRCPECNSSKVVTTTEQLWMINTGDFYCHSVKAHDSNSKAKCLDCEWNGLRHQLVEVE